MAIDYELLPAMKSNPKFIFFTDFDGTVTLKDSMFPSGSSMRAVHCTSPGH